MFVDITVVIHLTNAAEWFASQYGYLAGNQVYVCAQVIAAADLHIDRMQCLPVVCLKSVHGRGSELMSRKEALHRARVCCDALTFDLHCHF